MDFLTIDYLKTGTLRQQQAYEELTRLEIFEKLAVFHPTLAGTIPIDIALPNSDLDILCQYVSADSFIRVVSGRFGSQPHFEIDEDSKKLNAVVCRFKGQYFDIEIFGQNIPVEDQYAYRHLLVEYHLLEEKGQAFKNQIYELKKDGLKTEPAFAKALNLKGNPYEALLNLEADYDL